jgi:hypothetical protein
MTRRSIAIILTLVAMTVATACSSDDDSSDAANATEAAAMTSEAGSSSGGSSGGGGSSVDLGDVDVPLPDWADAVAVSESGPLTVVQFIVPLDQQEATIAFYDEWTGEQSEEYLRTDSESGGVTLQTETTAGQQKTIISILSPLEGDDFVTVTVSQGELE